MPYQFTPEGERLLAEVKQFMDDHIYPNEAEYYEQYEELGHDGDPPIMDKLKAAARERGLWNLFLPHLAPDAPGHQALEPRLRADLRAARQGRRSRPRRSTARRPTPATWRSSTCTGRRRSSATGWRPLLEGEIRSAFSMTEPDVASSDATNIGLRIERDGDEYVLNGTKWFSSGALRRPLQGADRDGQDRPRRASRHLQQSMIVVPKDSPGHHHRAHAARVRLRPRRRPPRDPSTRTCACPADNLLGEEGGGFAISQARLGPGRIHHCMRSIGVAERALGIMIDRALVRTTFGTLGGPQGPHPGLDRRVPHRDRHGPRVRAAHGPPDGHRRQQGRRHRDLGHQGRHART